MRNALPRLLPTEAPVETPGRRSRKKEKPFAVRLLVLNPYANGKLHAMAALGSKLTATLDGDWLTITAEVAP
jgi:hypothetical protein